jgi:hypothetical protein
LEALSGRDLTEVEMDLVEKRREAKQKIQSALHPETKEEDTTKAENDDGKKDAEVTAKPKDDAATADVAMADGAAIHENVACNSCSTCPIVGIRYKCAKCVFSYLLFGYN